MMSDDCFWIKNPTNSLSNLNSNHMNQLMDKISSDNCCAVRSILSSSHRNSCLKHLKILQTTPTLQIFSMNRPRRTRRLLSPTFKRKIRINRKKYSYFLSSFNSKYSDDIPLSSNHETLLSPSNSQESYSHIIHVKDEYEEITTPNPLILSMSEATKQMVFEENAQPIIYLDRLVFEH